MSVRNGLVALLAEQPMHGYQLRQEFERRTGGTWPLNIGQVYTTVQRLVRDGLVEPVPQGGTGPTDAEGDPAVERFRLTDAGRAAATSWWATPVERGAPARDELAIKLALAVTSPGVDVRAVVQGQRTETLRSLRDYTRLKVAPDRRRAGVESAPSGRPGDDDAVPAPVTDVRADLAWSLVLDSLIFGAEAEIRWLDHVEARLARAAHEAVTRTATDQPVAAPSAPDPRVVAPARRRHPGPAGSASPFGAHR